MNRREVFRRVFRTTAAMAGISSLPIVYGFWEASQIRIHRENIKLQNLPKAFEGKTLAVLADFHNGPYVSIPFIRQAKDIAQSLNADMYALVGDFAHKGTHTDEQLLPCLEALQTLEAPLGVYAVPGNHDMQNSGQVYRDCIAMTRITDLTNKSVSIRQGDDELWLAGVDDLWWGQPDLETAIREVPSEGNVILLSHNPDYAEWPSDPRISLMLSGHTHGGQVYLPLAGAPWMPSRFGEKYRHGLCQGPAHPVFVSRGLGEAGVPLRMNSPPEINLLTLIRSEG